MDQYQMMLEQLAAQQAGQNQAGEEEGKSLQEKILDAVKKGALNFESCFKYAWIPFIIGLSLSFQSQHQDPVSGQVQEKTMRMKMNETIAAVIPMVDVSFLTKMKWT